MLGRLIQTAASYGRGNNTLESATEESHTRNLLYGQSHAVYTLAQSPPTSPFASQVFRPGSFDDRGGLELEEKDVRILIAQDAGAEDKPTLLFDSRPLPNPSTQAVSHVRHTSMGGPRAPLPNDWKLQSQHAATIPLDSPFRNRSSTTMTGGPAPWTRSARDASTREEAFLECMFGVTSSTKATSTTKMHILPGTGRPHSRTDSRSRNPTDVSEQQSRRTPLHRARTSSTIVKSQTHSPTSGSDVENLSQDSILITRVFSVALSETVAPTQRSPDVPMSPGSDGGIDVSAADTSPNVQPQMQKKPKLVERKVPAFAVGLIISLPRLPDPHLTAAQGRPLSRSAHAHALPSLSSSYGSDMQSSWTFLNAIPESLASSTASMEEHDKRIEAVVNNEDVILRAIALLEIESARIIYQQLHKILAQASGPSPKTPKEKSMQRINQRIISITDPAAIAQAQSLREAARRAIRRVIYALRIPRVVIGLGFGGGHWLDEARTAYRVCGRRQQNFFLFTLLTAFLGHHTQWLQRLAPDWYQRQYRMFIKQQGETHALPQRTVVISDHRATSRRLIFLLASFLPGIQGLDGLQKPGEDLAGTNFSVSSPSSHVVRQESLRRAANRRMREHRLHTGSNDKVVLSTSAESGDSIITAERPRNLFFRKDSDAISQKGPSLLSVNDNENTRKLNVGTTSAVTSHPSTPVAVFSTQRTADSDGYFPPFIEQSESVATTGLANILRRSSSSLGNSSNMSSRWGSLVSGLSEMWSSKQPASGGSGSMTAYSSATGSVERPSTELKIKRNKSNVLQDMVDELDGEPSNSPRSPKPRFADQLPVSSSVLSSPTKYVAATPRLRVDDKDGVVDVDLDLPGFARLDMDDLFKSPTKSTHKSSTTAVRDTAESVRSLRSMPANPIAAQTTTDTNVAGYLKRHHEDFCLHAVRPYPELEEDIKRSMLAEPTSKLQENLSISGDEPWVPVCTTLVADMRTFSIRRLTLKRKADSTSNPNRLGSPNTAFSKSGPRKSDCLDVQHTFMDEDIKDFDTALADAIEKVLDLGDAVLSPSVLSPRMNHSRTASSGTMKSTSPSLSAPGGSSYTAVTHEYVRQDCRQVVLGALEDIVKEVCNDLSKLEKGRDIHGGRGFDVSAIKEEMKQENVLREGVKCWLLNLDQSRVY